MGEHEAGIARDDEVSRDLALASAPLISTLGHAVARQRLRATLLGEVAEPVRVDRFALRRELGRGGMGTVWLAHDAHLDREVALKFLRRSTDGEEAELRLLAEAKSLAKLSHPNVVPVYDAGRHEGRVWVAMEFVPGRTLRAWVEAEQPSPRQRLEAWIDAGRGLAAVHAAGLVHCDIKPDNVLRGDDGRVRIIDFGLVRGTESSHGERTLPGSGFAATTSEPRTETGHFVGTPAYAAPEQRAGGVVDARSDQFSWCMSVWEALGGARPSRKSLPERRGVVLPLPAGARMPGRVRRGLSRGLSRDPSLRFDSMDELLAALAPRRGRWVLGGTAAALGVTLGLLAAPRDAVMEPCVEAGRAIEARWGEDRRRAVMQGLGEARGTTAVEALDDYEERWREAARRSCEEVEVEQVRSPRSLDVRRACLEAQLDQLAALVDALEHGDPSASGSVGAWIAALDEPESCLAPALLDGNEPPESPGHRRALSQLRQELFAVRLGMRDPSLETRRDRAQQLRDRARAIGQRSTEGQVAEVEGELAYLAGDAAAARSRFGEVLDLGTDVGDASLIAAAWNGLGRVALGLDVDLEHAAWILDRQERTAGALGEASRALARALVQRGRWHLLRDERVAAESVIRRALAMLQAAGPSARWTRASALRNLANVMVAEGRVDEALALHDQARALELQGALDPTMVRAARGDALLAEGITQLGAGQLDHAATTIEQALDALQLERGPRSVDVATAHVTLAAILDAKGDVARARAHARTADEILRESHGVAHPDRVHALSALGTLEFREERFSAAVVAYARALELAALQADALPSTLAIHRANLGEALLRDGDLPRAKGLLERAVLDLESALGPDDPQLAIPNKALGEVLLARGEVPAARERLQRALVVLERHGVSAVEQAETRWALARALLADGEREAALASATAAATEFSALGSSWAGRAASIRAWMETNREE